MQPFVELVKETQKSGSNRDQMRFRKWLQETPDVQDKPTKPEARSKAELARFVKEVLTAPDDLALVNKHNITSDQIEAAAATAAKSPTPKVAPKSPKAVAKQTKETPKKESNEPAMNAKERRKAAREALQREVDAVSAKETTTAAPDESSSPKLNAKERRKAAREAVQRVVEAPAAKETTTAAPDESSSPKLNAKERRKAAREALQREVDAEAASATEAPAELSNEAPPQAAAEAGDASGASVMGVIAKLASCRTIMSDEQVAGAEKMIDAGKHEKLSAKLDQLMEEAEMAKKKKKEETPKKDGESQRAAKKRKRTGWEFRAGGPVFEGDLADLNSKLTERENARKKKEWSKSDALRDEVRKKWGVFLDDKTKEWWIWSEPAKKPVDAAKAPANEAKPAKEEAAMKELAEEAPAKEVAAEEAPAKEVAAEEAPAKEVAAEDEKVGSKRKRREWQFRAGGVPFEGDLTELSKLLLERDAARKKQEWLLELLCMVRDWKRADQLRGSLKKQFSVFVSDGTMEWWIQPKTGPAAKKGAAPASASPEQKHKATAKKQRTAETAKASEAPTSKASKLAAAREQPPAPVPVQGSPEQYLVDLTMSHKAFAKDYSFDISVSNAQVAAAADTRVLQAEGWKVTGNGMGLTMLMAVDCEMVETTDNSAALARVTVVDAAGRVLLHEFVKPTAEVTDLRSDITGLCSEDLQNAPSFEVVQAQVVALLRNGVILVGHGLYHDLEALKIDHKRVIDTALIFKFDGGLTGKPSLAWLSEQVLKKQLRGGSRVVLDETVDAGQHNSVEDAVTTLELATHVIIHNQGQPPAIPPPPLDAAEGDETKLCVHRIPKAWPAAAVKMVFGSSNRPKLIEPLKIGAKEFASTFVTFDSVAAAVGAFESLEGSCKLDSSGRRQKDVNIDDDTRFAVREMQRWPAGLPLQ